MRDCIFCRIAAGEIPAEVVSEDDHFVAFRDTRPLAPLHLLVIPRQHVASLDEAEALDDGASARALEFIAATARSAGVAESGYRVITNTGPDAGQEVMHLHWHVIGGTRLGGIMRELGAIEQHVKDDATAALKAGDKRRREALNSFCAALKKERIDSRKQPTEADELTVLKRERKRRAEAIELYDGAGRKDLADQERYEAELLKGYMPEELSDAELEALVGEGIAATDAVTPKDMGKVMGWLKPKVGGRADGKKLSDLVRGRLGG